MEKFGGNFRTVICELSQNKCCSHKCCWQVFSGKIENGLKYRYDILSPNTSAYILLEKQNIFLHNHYMEYQSYQN